MERLETQKTTAIHKFMGARQAHTRQMRQRPLHHAHFTNRRRAHDNGRNEHVFGHQEWNGPRQFLITGIHQNAQDRGFFRVSHELRRIIGWYPSLRRHQLMHTVRGALGLQNANIERQIRAAEQQIHHFRRLAKAVIKRVIAGIIKLNGGIAKHYQAKFKRTRIDDKGQSGVRNIGPPGDRRPANLVTYAEDSQHVPVVERRRRMKKRQGDIIIIGDNRKYNIRMQILDTNKPVHQRLPHFPDRINAQLQNDRHDLIAFAFGIFVIGDKCRKLNSQLNAGNGITRFNDFVKNTGVETRLGFDTHHGANPITI